MIITSKQDLAIYQKAADLSLRVLLELKNAVKPGIYPIEIDELAKKLCQKHHTRPSFLGVAGRQGPYPHATCICVNDAVVHGIPSSTEKFKPGDTVKVDFGLVYENFFTDHCFTVVIGQPDPKTELLVKTAQKAIQSAALQAITGATTGDLGHTMHAIALAAGFDVLKQYTGHGIGHTLHDQPMLPAHGQPHTGTKLEKGMVLCVEAQLVTGSDQVYVADDGWTVKMTDHGNTAMFEYMVVVQDKKPILLTPNFDWPIVV